MAVSDQWRAALGESVVPGDLIGGRYRLDQIVGAGGMGVVIEAWHVELDQKVAVKVLRVDRRGKSSTRERFKREARACFRMTSEHVVRIIDLGSLPADSLYMVMEFLDGQDFAELLANFGPFAPDMAVGYMLQVCEAVAEAHALGVVHRDLKPNNLFLCKRADGSPCVKVLDFGLAKVEAPGESITRVNRGMGTPRYMSPEQWVSAKDVGPGADIWALGVILFELVSGECPFDAEGVNELCQKVLFAPAPKTVERVPHLPQGLAGVIDRCLHKKPEQRYASIAELAAALLPHAPQLTPRQARAMGRKLPLPQPSPGWAMTLSESQLRSTGTTDADLEADTTADNRDGVLVSDDETPFHESTTVTGSESDDAAWLPVEDARAVKPQREQQRHWQVAALVAVILGGVVVAVMMSTERPRADAPPLPQQQPVPTTVPLVTAPSGEVVADAVINAPSASVSHSAGDVATTTASSAAGKPVPARRYVPRPKRPKKTDDEWVPEGP